MSFAEDEICQVTENIWKSILDIDIQPDPQAVLPDEPQHLLTGCVQISGAWEGVVVVHCSAELARQVTARMFRLTPETVSDDDMKDVLGELANMIGGNIKTLLPGPSGLSLPTALEGLDYPPLVPGSRCLSQVAFVCQDQPLLVTLMQWNEAPAAAESPQRMRGEENQREFTRVPIQIEAQVTGGDAPMLRGPVRNVSMNGLFLLCDHPLPIDTDCRLTLLLGDAENQTCINARGIVRRLEDTGMGIEFSHILGLESFNHLRNLVLYNASTDAVQVEQEFKHHVGLKRRSEDGRRQADA